MGTCVEAAVKRRLQINPYFVSRCIPHMCSHKMGNMGKLFPHKNVTVREKSRGHA